MRTRDSWPRRRGDQRARLIGAAVGVALVGVFWWGHRPPAPPAAGRVAATTATATPTATATATSSPTSSAPTTTTTTTTTTTALPRVTQPPVPRAQYPVINAATAAVRAWQVPNTAARAGALNATCTPALARSLAAADPARIPDARPAAGVVDIAGEALADIKVTLADRTVVLVTVQRSGNRWLASGITPGV